MFNSCRINKHPIKRALAGMVMALSLALTACQPATPDFSANPPIRIGAYYWPGMYWVDIAHKKGWFKEAGLNVEWVDTNADYFASFDALYAGKLDIVAFTQFDFILRNANGQRAVAFLASDYSNGSEALIARPGIGNMRALAGKKVGLSKGTYLEYIWAVAAQRAGLDINTVQIVDTPGELAHELLAQRKVDAILTWEPFAAQALAAVKGNKLFDTGQVPGLNWAIYAAKPDFLAQRGAEVSALLGVWRRTTLFMRQSPDVAYAIVAEVNKKTVAEVRDFTALDRILDLRDNLTAFSYATGYDSLHGSTRQMNDFMLQQLLVRQRLDTNALFDARWLRGLQYAEMKE